MKRFTFYLHSKNVDMMGLLRWAEEQTESVIAQILGTARRGQQARFTGDPEVLSYQLWGFLNVSLIEDAWAMFAGVVEENGFEVWRTVVLAITQMSQAEVLRFEIPS